MKKKNVFSNPLHCIVTFDLHIIFFEAIFTHYLVRKFNSCDVFINDE